MGETTRRFVGLDLHKDYVMVGALDEQQQIVLTPRRILLAQFDAWAKRHLRPTDQIVLEATTNAWYIHDLLQPLVARVVVADPAKAKAKMALPVKTDRRDTLGLAALLVTNNVPEVWVPPMPVRELRVRSGASAASDEPTTGAAEHTSRVSAAHTRQLWAVSLAVPRALSRAALLLLYL